MKHSFFYASRASMLAEIVNDHRNAYLDLGTKLDRDRHTGEGMKLTELQNIIDSAIAFLRNHLNATGK